MRPAPPPCAPPRGASAAGRAATRRIRLSAPRRARRRTRPFTTPRAAVGVRTAAHVNRPPRARLLSGSTNDLARVERLVALANRLLEPCLRGPGLERVSLGRVAGHSVEDGSEYLGRVKA